VRGSTVIRRETPLGWAETVESAPAPQLRGLVSGYYAFREQSSAPIRRREGPGTDVVVVLAFEEEWTVDGERHQSFVGGLHDRQVSTENQGRADGMQINLAPTAAFMLFGVPLHTIAQQTLPLDHVLADGALVERLAAEDDETRFELLDGFFEKRLADAAQPSRGIVWAWSRLRETHGQVPVTELAEELGWSRKRIVTRFREQIGLPPKTVARLFRFERARELAGRAERPDWARIAVECGYYDQSHLIRDFRAVTGRTPETFFQDTLQAAA
jgi:AraC-like DNA-binding protein